MNYKISKIYNILDQMLSKYRGKLENEKLNNSFSNVNPSIELLQKIGDKNKFIGILMCFKFFKSIINKYSKITSKKKKIDCIIDLNKLNEKLDLLISKMEMLNKNGDNNSNINSDINSNVINEECSDNIKLQSSHASLSSQCRLSSFLDL